MIEIFYTDIKLYRYSDGDFDTMAGYSLLKTFKGLIQSPSNTKTFNNGKDTSTISGTLFCGVDEEFKEKDIIELNGVRFKIAGAGSQPLGVSGLKPQKGQHAEYNLIYTQESI